MRVSLKWLNHYCALENIKWEDVRDTLTELGLEVEGVEHLEPVAAKVVVAEVMTCEQHPNADKLRLCQVKTDASETWTQVVCGAPNVRAGMKVAFAGLGAVLPGDFKIKKTKIRGIESTGMICSQQELRISDEHDGILELPASAVPGTPVAELVDIADTVFDIGITPNRADCLGMIGVARDLAARMELELSLPAEAQGDLASLPSGPLVELRTASASARFCAVQVEGVQALSSPAWLQQRVLAAGMRPINVIVDATNFVMMEQGHPVHAYDAGKLTDEGFVVRDALEGESLEALDGHKYTLGRNDLVVCNGASQIVGSPLMGGEMTQVGPTTQSIVCEAAHFDPLVVRKMSKRLALRSEASHRFERGVDEYACQRVVKRLATLIVQVMHELGVHGARIASQVTDIHRQPKSLARIGLRVERARKLLHLPQLKKAECIAILERLGCTKLDETDERILIEVPSYRADLTREIDLIEEVGRIYGLDRIRYIAPQTVYTGEKESCYVPFVDVVRSAATSAALVETILVPFVGTTEYAALGLDSSSPFMPTIELENPIQAQAAKMPSLLLPLLLKAVDHNRRKGQPGARLFEIGKTYMSRAQLNADAMGLSYIADLAQGDSFCGLPNTSPAVRQRPVVERRKLGIVLDGPAQEKTWQSRASIDLDFFTIKAKVAQVLASAGVEGFRFRLVPEKGYPFLHPKAAAEILVGEKVIGFLGELHPQTLLNLGLRQHPPVVAEIDLDTICSQGNVGKLNVQPKLRQFPPLVRDFAFSVPQQVSYADFVSAIDAFKKKKNLKSYRLFDLYLGEGLAPGQKSLAWKFVFESDEKTLTDKEVDKESRHLLAHLEAAIDAKQR